MILALDDVRDEPKYGGKAVHLGHAPRAGLPVPPGFALGHEDADRVARGDARTIDEVLVAFRTLGGPVAVRSSAVGEDSGDASFAGQHETLLGIVDERSLLEALRRVHRSARTEAALAYRKRLDLVDEPRMGIVVQKLVLADVAGVLFTRNPVTHRDEIVIEASWGLGEAVVAGLVTPDRFRLTHDGLLLERTAGEKDLAIRVGPDGTTVEVPIVGPRIHEPCLGDRELRVLVELAHRARAFDPDGSDLEFAFVGGEVYLLQRRAITRG